MSGSVSATSPRRTPSRRGRSPRFSSDGSSHASSGHLGDNYPTEAATIFASSLDIRVEGALPIKEDSEDESTSREPQSAVLHGTEKRTPRKSKTDALAALNNQTRDSSSLQDEDDVGTNITAKYRNGTALPVPATLDLSSVKTAKRHEEHCMPTVPRPFGLKDCPEYYPTTEQFKDPMEYIKSIAEEAKEYGICKIVPPSDWQMPFVTNTEDFRFKTRLQRLNSIEASSRAKLNFLEQLYQYHQQQGNPRISVPTINHKPLDLWLLRKEVNKLGGYEAVTANRKWSDLGRILGYRGIPGLSTQIKNSYARVILPYEQFCERTKVSPTMSPAVARDTAVKVEDASVPSSPLTATSSPLSEPPDESENKDANKSATRPRRSGRMNSTDQGGFKKPISLSQPVVPPPIFYDKPENMRVSSEQSCEICHKANRGDKMLLCDECDCGFHMDCLDPPIATIPADNWFCYNCLSTSGGDYGFDEGEEHSLSSFHARDLEFRRMWFGSHFSNLNKHDGLPPHMCNELAGARYTEYDVEEEFWRLVQSQEETVEIEYGADVHSSTHGSAMPTLETHPLNPYSQHPWNLNNIPILSDSLLRYIKSEISGMTVPWTYVGMVFSTFCWHNEDHYTYSLNYMHWGETKTWYGIPGDDAELFEAAIKGEAPDLFQAQPDLLFQLVTLMNPRRLTEAGVRVFACNQRAGEFVITFPKAYHAGFNHGLNFNEAVNFALPDWLPFGLACVERYREHRKLPVFSHDELLLTIAQHSTGIKTAMWLLDSIKEMTERELSERTRARARGLTEFVSEEESRPDDQYQCSVCKAFCYLSHVMCRCDTKVVCVDHIDLLCDKVHQPNHLSLRKRIDDDDLKKLLDKFIQSAGIPSQWNAKLNRILNESPRPQLRQLRALLAEGDRINYPLQAMPNLRKCVTRANDWVDFANSFLIRKQSRKRSRKSRARNDSMAISDDPADRMDRSLDELYSHLKDVEILGFDCPEIGHLQNLAEQVEKVKAKAIGLLKNKVTGDEEAHDAYLSECRRLLLDGSSLNVNLNELNEVEKIVESDVLLKELSEKLDDQDVTLSLQDVRKLLNRARACGLPSDNKYLRLLEEREAEGGHWEKRAQELCRKTVKTIAELEQFSDLESTVPIDIRTHEKIQAELAKAKDYEKQAIAWLNPEPGAIKPRLFEVERFIGRAENGFSIGQITTLKEVARIAAEFEGKCEKVIRKEFRAFDENFIDTITKWCEYAKEHLTMFCLPFFDKVTAQLESHRRWIRELPWYCERHGTSHGIQVLNDVVECTGLEDDLPPEDDFVTCICTKPVNPPPHGGSSDAVQCDHCGARFHGECAKTGGSCPFCDHHHWNGEMRKERSYHFCFLPSLLDKAPDITRNYAKEYSELNIIVRRVDRLSGHIGHFLALTSQPVHQLPEYIPTVRHYMRKLYKIQFAVSPNPDISFGLDLAGLHRILAGRPLTNGGSVSNNNGNSISTSGSSKRSRRPKFTFVLDLDPDWGDGTRCFCRGQSQYLLNSPTVACGHCKRRYHSNCVFYPQSSSPQSYLCPLCSLRKSKNYAYSDIRVRLADSSLEPDVYVNIQDTIATHSQELLFIRMAKPVKQTLFVDLVDFEPAASNDSQFPSNSHSRQLNHPPSPHLQSRVSTPSNGNGSGHSYSMRVPPNVYAPPSPHIQPPPPPWSSSNWSRWGTVSTPAQPPFTNRRHHPDVPRPISQSLPPQSHVSRKRKHEDIILQPPVEDSSRVSASSIPPPHKRRAIPSPGSVTPVSPPPRSLPPVSPPPHPHQSLSPSLRKLMADPTPDAPASSPRASYNIPPIRQNNGNDSRSPTLPGVETLMLGMPSQ